MSTIQRWRASKGAINKVKMEVSPRGKWVTYADYMALHADSVAEIDRLRAELAQANDAVQRLTAPAEQQPVAEVIRGGTPQFGYATVLQRWLPSAESLPSGVSLLYAHPSPQPADAQADALRLALTTLERVAPVVRQDSIAPQVHAAIAAARVAVAQPAAAKEAP